jgi:hypothetical protein
MTATITSVTSAPTAQSMLVLQALRDVCTEALRRCLPQPDSITRGVWNDGIRRTIMAVCELQRVEVELYTELDRQRLDITLLARVIEVLATKHHFPDFKSPTLPLELEPHLRLLALALRLYKYNGRSLQHTLHTTVYEGITDLSVAYNQNREHCDTKYRVDDLNVLFLLKHCQYLLLSIDSTESLTQKIATRAVISFDETMTGLGQGYHNIRPTLMEIMKRKRSRGKWHPEYVDLEDIFGMVIAGDVRARSGQSPVEVVMEEASIATAMLHASMKFHLEHQVKTESILLVVGKAVAQVTENFQASGPAEEHSEYLPYGILDLLYQLSFRIRKRSREECFFQMLKTIRIVLEQSSSPTLHVKATDLFIRICKLAEKDQIVYGSDDDHKTIQLWIQQNEGKAEIRENSVQYDFFFEYADL